MLCKCNGTLQRCASWLCSRWGRGLKAVPAGGNNEWRSPAQPAGATPGPAARSALSTAHSSRNRSQPVALVTHRQVVGAAGRHWREGAALGCVVWGRLPTAAPLALNFGEHHKRHGRP